MKRQNAETDRAFRILDICNELLNWILMIILVILFCYGTYGIGDSYMLEENAMPEHYEIYRPTEEDYGNFDELKAQNSDVCGWITIYGTHVDYPVVQSEDNSTYLMRNPRGEYSLSGSIFMDYMNQKDFSDFNTIIYGHHMDAERCLGILTSIWISLLRTVICMEIFLPMEKIMDWSYLHSWSWMLIIQVFM